MQFDISTLREELAAMEAAIKANPRDHDLVNRYIATARKLRDMEFIEAGYVTSRGITGY